LTALVIEIVDLDVNERRASNGQ